MSRVESHKSYRPLTVLTFRYFNFYFSGLQPHSYHVVNVLLHSVASVLVFLLSHLLLGGSGIRWLERAPGSRDYGRFLQLQWSTYAGLIFAVHSVHTEAVRAVNTIILLIYFECIYCLKIGHQVFSSLHVNS